MTETWPFAAALAVMVGLAVLEGLGLLFALSPSNALESLLPEMPDGVDSPLGWLHLGKVPALVLLILLLTGFAVAGYVIQGVTYKWTGVLWPAWLASIPALFAGVATVRGVGALLARVIPKDETSAVSEVTLIGRAGIIVKGHARHDYAAEAKVRDSYGRSHYVLVEPDVETEVFNEGSDVLLVKKVGAKFKCIRNPHPELL